jgi:hypothetical protein
VALPPSPEQGFLDGSGRDLGNFRAGLGELKHECWRELMCSFEGKGDWRAYKEGQMRRTSNE